MEHRGRPPRRDPELLRCPACLGIKRLRKACLTCGGLEWVRQPAYEIRQLYQWRRQVGLL